MLLAGVMCLHVAWLAALMWRRASVPNVLWFPRVEIAASLAVLPILAWGSAGEYLKYRQQGKQLQVLVMLCGMGVRVMARQSGATVNVAGSMCEQHLALRGALWMTHAGCCALGSAAVLEPS